jgi:outer membrane protein assembly factor BamE (lipoprotein component of BamABCDE complex)
MQRSADPAMNIRFELRWLVLTVFLLSGCAALRAPSIPPGASMADVESKIGKPVDVLSTPASEVVWQYPSGPFGQQTYIVTFGKDERVKSISQALTGENFATIRKGMSRDEIRLMFGRPFTSVTYRPLDEEVWSYRYLIPVNDNRIFNVHFDAETGRVKTTSDQRDELFHPINLGGGQF